MVRGEIFRLRLPRQAKRGEQSGVRFGVVVQADELLGLSTVLLAPTSASAPPRTYRPVVELSGVSTRVLVEQTTAVSVERLGASVGRLSALELTRLDDALAIVLGL